jgi:hypothetical protein
MRRHSRAFIQEVTMSRLTAIAVSFAMSTTALSGTGLAQGHCATEPPPKGLVERCQGLTMLAPRSLSVFRIQLYEWMQTCVISERAKGLVFGNDSVESTWKLIDTLNALPLSSPRTVRIVPTYQPLTFTQAGRTCYGVKNVTFDVRRQRAAAVEEGPIELTPGPTVDMIKESAEAGIKALQDPSIKPSPEVSRMLGVLEMMARYGKDFNDTYYPVAPVQGYGGSLMNAPACFKDDARWTCLPANQALTQCEQHLATDIVNAHVHDKLSAKSFGQVLESRAFEIQRGVDYLSTINDDTGAAFCPAVRDVIRPRVGELAKKGKTTVYGAGGY